MTRAGKILERFVVLSEMDMDDDGDDDTRAMGADMKPHEPEAVMQDFGDLDDVDDEDEGYAEEIDDDDDEPDEDWV